MNLTGIQDSLKDLRVIIGLVTALLGLGSICGYQLSPKPIAKSIMCKNEEDQINILNQQLTDLRTERLDDVTRVQSECMTTQDEICAGKIMKYRTACLSLKCEICKASR